MFQDVRDDLVDAEKSVIHQNNLLDVVEDVHDKFLKVQLHLVVDVFLDAAVNQDVLKDVEAHVNALEDLFGGQHKEDVEQLDDIDNVQDELVERQIELVGKLVDHPGDNQLDHGIDQLVQIVLLSFLDRQVLSGVFLVDVLEHVEVVKILRQSCFGSCCECCRQCP